MQKKVCFIHGGGLVKNNDELFEKMKERTVNPFEERKKRKHTLQTELPNHIVIQPQMPNKEMASYKIWKLWFEKHIPYLEAEELVLIGHSLGVMFLLKYLSENTFPYSINQLHFVAPALDDLRLQPGDDYLGNFAFETENISLLEHKAEKIYLRHSKDDPVVPFSIVKESKNISRQQNS